MNYLLVFFAVMNTFAISLVAGEIETIKALRVDQNGITLTVDTGGCTEKKHFRVRKLGLNPTEISLIRIKPDNCKSFSPESIDIKFTYEELGITRGEQFEIEGLLYKASITPGMWPGRYECLGEKLNVSYVRGQSERDQKIILTVDNKRHIFQGDKILRNMNGRSLSVRLGMDDGNGFITYNLELPNGYASKEAFKARVFEQITRFDLAIDSRHLPHPILHEVSCIKNY